MPYVFFEISTIKLRVSLRVSKVAVVYSALAELIFVGLGKARAARL